MCRVCAVLVASLQKLMTKIAFTRETDVEMNSAYNAQDRGRNGSSSGSSSNGPKGEKTGAAAPPLASFNEFEPSLLSG